MRSTDSGKNWKSLLPHDTEQHDEESFGELLRSARPDTTPRPGFQDELRQSLLARIRAREYRTAGKAGRTWRLRWIRIPSAAAVAVAVFIGLWWLIAGDVNVASAGFGEMLRRIREARTVTFDSVYSLPGKPEEKVRVYMGQSGRSRATWSDGVTHICDMVQGKYLALTPSESRAVIRSIPLEGPRIYYYEPLEALRGVGESAGKFTGTEILDDLEVNVYQVATEQGSLRVWVDPRKELPTRIVRKIPVGEGQEVVWLLENFCWNEPLSDSLFSLEVPPEYTLEEPLEESLLDLLRICAELSDGTFPAQLDAKAVYDLVFANRLSKIPDTNLGADRTFGVLKTNRETKEIYRKCLRGQKFIEKIKENGTWRYVGAGHKLGDKTATICWWKLPQSPTYRVVYGDLKIKNIPAEQFPPSSGSLDSHKNRE